MPRLPPSLLRYAASRSTHLARLLRECRDLESASNELRWLAEHAYSDCSGKLNSVSRKLADVRLQKYILRRSKGEPLQYILGSQPFGELDILCQPNVLIPRPETELLTTTLAALLEQMRNEGVINWRQPMKIADLCTGTGCIALLLHHLLRSSSPQGQPQALQILGVDISPYALSLAPKNLLRNLQRGVLDVSSLNEITFEHLDVLKLGVEAEWSTQENISALEKTATTAACLLNSSWDVIISNPPYISPSDYAPGGTVGRSVRNYEPRLALVPPAFRNRSGQEAVEQADRFYEALLHVANRVEAKVLVMEVGDSMQAERVRRLAVDVMPDDVSIETWRDDSSIDRYEPQAKADVAADAESQAHERAVVVWTGSWAKWRSRTTMKQGLPHM